MFVLCFYKVGDNVLFVHLSVKRGSIRKLRVNIVAAAVDSMQCAYIIQLSVAVDWSATTKPKPTNIV